VTDYRLVCSIIGLSCGIRAALCSVYCRSTSRTAPFARRAGIDPGSSTGRNHL